MSLVLRIPNILWMEEALARWKPDEILSVLPPGEYRGMSCEALLEGFPRRVTVPVSDFDGTLDWSEEDQRIAIEECGLVPPDDATVSAILTVGRAALERARERQWTMLVHCHAGVSRSPAAALLILALEDGPGAEERSCARLREVAPWALPNKRIVSIGDRLLGRGGRLLDACDLACHQRTDLDAAGETTPTP